MDLKDLPFARLGDVENNVDYFLDSEAKYVYLRLSLDDAARARAPLSSTGKTRLLATTSGFTKLTRDVKLSVMATIPK